MEKKKEDVGKLTKRFNYRAVMKHTTFTAFHNELGTVRWYIETEMKEKTNSTDSEVQSS